MGSHIPLDIDVNHAIHLYEAGESISEVAVKLGVGAETIRRRMINAGYRTRRTASDAAWCRSQHRYGDVSESIRMYLNGATLEDARKHAGVPRRFLEKAIIKSGHVLRTQAQSLGLRYTRLTVAERRSITAKANIAVRGKKASPKRQERRAKTNELTLQLASRADLILCVWLSQRGITLVPQKAVGPYNLDIAIEELLVAVEVNGPWHYFPGRSGGSERRKYLLDRGWSLIEVSLSTFEGRPWKHLSPACADKIVTILDRIRRGEPLGSEDAMLGGDGNPLAG